ncbi:glycoside hydrolase family 88 protein [Reichenbachiella sp. MSK19-1]|uniref:glycoside hydrolase family 88 protein n=1 Tax=Reichenbachiella sp. MSK19-1 TaxID=1897631 RepID=UPI000E6BF989|nr:glycoside hydrolase family 88 protein [Reichenbachiella sp. MSK19-1]RJE74015.1 glucuronyl hydrolase [Reichenbachiella sp. MSK19-1]
MKNSILIVVLAGLLGLGCQQKQKEVFNVDQQLDYCVAQAKKTLQQLPNDSASIPRNIPHDSDEWTLVKYRDWTSGFWPGTLWYLYEYTGDTELKNAADQFTMYLEPLSVESATDHDLGFQVYNSAGNGYRLTQNPEYKEMILKASDTLATLYNPVVGTILSWPVKTEYPHNTIIDNMINLEMLSWAAKNGGTDSLKNIAETHADKTMNNHFRDDYSAYHVVIYDTINGNKIKGITHQGYADHTMWARGQGWAVYGYTMMYRETKNPEYLKTAHQTARVYLDRLPEDLIPYWDFDAPNIPNEPRDASAAALVASALLELSKYSDEELAQEYVSKATAMLEELSTNYQSGNKNSAFLLHSTGHMPNGSEIDASIIYADYYYVEALLRLKKLQQGEPVVNSVLASFEPEQNKS